MVVNGKTYTYISQTEFAQALAALDVPLRSHLTSDETRAVFKLAEQLHPGGETKQITRDLIRRVFFGQLPLAELPSKLQQAIDVSAEQAYAVAGMLATNALSSLSEHFPDASKLAAVWTKQSGGLLATEPTSARTGDDGTVKVESTVPIAENQADANSGEPRIMEQDRVPDMGEQGSASDITPFEQAVDGALGRLGINLPQKQRRRVYDVALSQLKEIRMSIEAAQTYARTAAEGGAGVPPSAAEDLAEEIERMITDEEISRAMIIGSAGFRVPTMPGSTQKVSKSFVQTPPLPIANIAPAVASAPTTLVSPPMPAAEPAPEAFQAYEVPEIPETPEAIPEMTLETVETDSGRPVSEIFSLDDVAKVSVESLRAADNMTDAVVNLAGQAQALTNAGLAGKQQIIAAWQQSPLYRLYVTTGTMSIQEQIDIDGLAARREQQGEPFLSKTEFQAVADLSSKLQA